MYDGILFNYKEKWNEIYREKNWMELESIILSETTQA